MIVLYALALLFIIFRVVMMIPMRTVYGPPPAFNYVNIGYLLVAILFAIAIFCATRHEKYFLVYVVAGVKIALPEGTKIMRTITSDGVVDFQTAFSSFNVLFFLLMIAWLVFFIREIKNTKFELVTPSLKAMILPLIIIVYGSLYILVEYFIVAALLIALAVLLDSKRVAAWLYLTFFIVEPFRMLQYFLVTTSGGTPESRGSLFWPILNWSIAFLLLGYGIYYLITETKAIKESAPVEA